MNNLELKGNTMILITEDGKELELGVTMSELTLKDSEIEDVNADLFSRMSVPISIEIKPSFKNSMNIRTSFLGYSKPRAFLGTLGYMIVNLFRKENKDENFLGCRNCIIDCRISCYINWDYYLLI